MPMEQVVHLDSMRYSIMKRLLMVSLVAAAAAVATGCVTMNVATHLERGVNLSQFRTWDWGPADALPTGDPRLDNNVFFKDHLEGSVEKALAGRGYTRAPRGVTPDLLLHYHASINQRFQVNEPDVNCSAPGCEASVMEYEQGTLVLDMVDVKRDKVVWRGWAQDSVQGNIDNQDRMERQIDEAVTKLFSRFPRAF
jgi:hypothetical protein